MRAKGLVVILLVASLAPLAASAETPPGLTMQAQAAFDGYVKYGEWLPVWVELENNGPDIEAEIRVRIAGYTATTTFAAPVSLPTGSRKRIPLYVLPNNYSHELEVQLVAADDLLASRKVTVAPQSNITYLVGLIAPARGALVFLAGISLPGQSRPLQVLDLPLSDLSERAEGLRSFDCLVLNDLDTSTLTPEQRAALEAWVREGGRLVIGGGAGARRTAAGLPDLILPLLPGHEVELDTLPSLADFAGAEAIRVPGPFVVATGEPGQGQTLAGEPGLPLLRERAVGQGSVDWVALDLSASPFDAWVGTTAFWERLLSPGAAYPTWLPADVSARQMRAGPMSYALSNLPALDLPSVQGLAVLLGVYILLVGPVNYLVLRWRKRLHWAWVSTPLLTLLFSGGAFGLGYLLRGGDLILNKIAIVSLDEAGRASVSSYLGLFSPTQQAYEVQVQGNSLLSPLNPDYNPWGPWEGNPAGEVVLVQGDPGRVRGLAVNQWSMQTFMTEGTWVDLGRIAGDLRLEGQAMVGRVRNETNLTLTDVVLILNSQFTRLSDLSPGAEAPVTLDLTTAAAQLFGPPLSYRLFEAEYSQMGPNGPSRELQLKQTVVDSIFQGGAKFAPWLSSVPPGGGGAAPQGVVLLAWLDQAPPEVRVAGRTPTQRTTALLVAPLAYRLPDQGAVSLPLGLIPGTIIELPTEGGPCGSSGTASVYIGRGQAVFEFQTPALDGLRIEELTLNLGSDGGWWQPPEIALYDWEAGEWGRLGNPALGLNVVADADRLVSGDGRVRVRLASEGGSSGCLYLDLGLEGTRY